MIAIKSTCYEMEICVSVCGMEEGKDRKGQECEKKGTQVPGGLGARLAGP